jgi:hypothetical protein
MAIDSGKWREKSKSSDELNAKLRRNIPMKRSVIPSTSDGIPGGENARFGDE